MLQHASLPHIKADQYLHKQQMHRTVTLHRLQLAIVYMAVVHLAVFLTSLLEYITVLC